MNQVTLIGRLTKDPELQYTQSNTPVCRFTLAVDRMKKDEADFIRITAWNKTAELVDRYMRKGRQIAIQGRIQTGSYEKDGQKIFTTDVVADRVEFIGNSQASERTAEEVENAIPDEWKPSDTFAKAEDDIPF